MKISKMSIIAMLVVMLSSCDSLIYYGEGDCDVQYKVRFVYDYNMKWADATAAEVDAVGLWVFDTAGGLVWSGTQSGEQLAADDYAVTIDVPAGTYNMIAWCSGQSNSGMSEIGGYTLAGGNSPQSLDGLVATIDHAVGAPATIDTDLNRLFYGQLWAVELPDTYGTVEVTMPLVKDTNVVRVMLQQVSGRELNPDDFIFTISDDNIVLDYDNSVITGNPVVYSPWDQYYGRATMGDDADSSVGVNVLIAEMTTSRLIDGHSTVLTITRRDGTVVLRIPLLDYLLMVKGNYNSSLSNQEYLDRKDEYNITFFLDDNLNWYSSSIMIEAWRVVFQTME